MKHKTAGAEEKQKQLEEAYERGLALEKSGRFAQAAAAYRQVLALDKADCAGASVRLAAMGLGETPKTAPKAYIAALFDQYADIFELILVDSLGYDVPNLLRTAIETRFTGRKFAKLLDLGCGTGLIGEAFADLALVKTGVDISANMVEIAAEREIYQQLFTGDIELFLRETAGEEQWDIIIAADVLPYIGDVRAFFSLAGQALETGGIFAFSTENLDFVKPHSKAAKKAAGDYAVGPHQRFAHRSAYLGSMLAEAGFKTDFCQNITVRQEQNKPVAGQIYLAVKA